MKKCLLQGLVTPRVVFSSCLAAVVLASSVGSAFAQTIDARKWELDFHAGGDILVSNPTDGTVSLPGAGESFTGGAGFPPTRRVSSWYFGDGATLVNQVALLFNLTQRLRPLDPLLSQPMAERQHGGSLGVRLSRVLGERLATEFNLDYSLAQPKITSAALAEIEASRASFLAVFSQFQAASGSTFVQSHVTSTADIADGNARQIISTGTLNINLTTRGKVIPYTT